MKFLFIFNHQPYDGSDLTWNGLRLAKNLHNRGHDVRIFLISDSIDLARDCIKKPENYDNDLVAMLKEMYNNGVKLKVCGICQARCGIYKNEPYFDEKIKATMNDLANWCEEADKIITF
ncbi:DsrE/DsrF/TusD sulfur relay family protein [Caminibacter mediatlanticus]|uniref:DsrE-like protein n=1 Tax=Caminibacter mediatlanticus TB-2 TaxID=391592 RepID=A0AAI9F3F2_9BACT|nr:DsrE family protein [Caminibacter mediatlanticus]EDM24576.1 DsrE-like protein [Caminibacter mediatlanticus TB-2]